MENRNNRSFGTIGEEIAAKYLSENGYRIIKTNYRAGRIGEIDIIAADKDTLCFIEVKARSSTLYGTPAEAVTRSKQNSIIRLAKVYLSNTHSFDQNVRFDVIEILFNKNSSEKSNVYLNHIKNAFWNWIILN